VSSRSWARDPLDGIEGVPEGLAARESAGRRAPRPRRSGRRRLAPGPRSPSGPEETGQCCARLRVIGVQPQLPQPRENTGAAGVGRRVLTREREAPPLSLAEKRSTYSRAFEIDALLPCVAEITSSIEDRRRPGRIPTHDRQWRSVQSRGRAGPREPSRSRVTCLGACQQASGSV
jgi:hypothetical protein